MTTYIEIDKTQMPYEFDIQLDDDVYTLTFKYNQRFDYIAVDLSLNDEELVNGEKVVYGEPLFDDIFDDRFPAVTIVAKDEAGKEKRVTFENLGSTVLLYIEDGESG